MNPLNCPYCGSAPTLYRCAGLEILSCGECADIDAPNLYCAARTPLAAVEGWNAAVVEYEYEAGYTEGLES